MEKRDSIAVKGLTDDFSHKEIIDTFFGKSVPGKFGKKSPKKHKRTQILIAAIILSVLALSAIIIILYKVRVFDYRKETAVSKFRYSENIIKNGQIKRPLIEEARFDGDARGKSSFLKNSARLVNSGEYGRASLTVKFWEPLDLEGKNILILGRAEHGTKKINLILKDSQNRFYECPNICFSSSWNLKHVYLGKRRGFDLGRVGELKVEFGSHTAGNEKNSTIYLKDITIRNRKSQTK